MIANTMVNAAINPAGLGRIRKSEHWRMLMVASTSAACRGSIYSRYSRRFGGAASGSSWQSGQNNDVFPPQDDKHEGGYESGVGSGVGWFFRWAREAARVCATLSPQTPINTRFFVPLRFLAPCCKLAKTYRRCYVYPLRREIPRAHLPLGPRDDARYCARQILDCREPMQEWVRVCHQTVRRGVRIYAYANNHYAPRASDGAAVSGAVAGT
jgi:hypothetical protein